VYRLLGENVPFLRLPVRPGRSISTMIEVAARDRLLKLMGHDSAAELDARLEARVAEEAVRVGERPVGKGAGK